MSLSIAELTLLVRVTGQPERRRVEEPRPHGLSAGGDHKGGHVSVIMIAEVAGADAGMVDVLRAAGVMDAMGERPGFVSHISGAASSGFRVIEVWESREAHQSWVEDVILPNMPPDAPPPTVEYIDLLDAVPER